MATDDRPHTASDDAAREQFAAMLRGSVVPTLVVGALAVTIAAFSGPRAAWSAALGAALVVAFFSLSLLVMRQSAHLAPTTVMAVVLATYTAKIVALGAVMVTLTGVNWLSGQALAVAVIICTLVWLAFEMRAFTRLRVLVAPDAGADRGAP